MIEGRGERAGCDRGTGMNGYLTMERIRLPGDALDGFEFPTGGLTLTNRPCLSDTGFTTR